MRMLATLLPRCVPRLVRGRHSEYRLQSSIARDCWHLPVFQTFFPRRELVLAARPSHKMRGWCVVDRSRWSLRVCQADGADSWHGRPVGSPILAGGSLVGPIRPPRGRSAPLSRAFPLPPTRQCWPRRRPPPQAVAVAGRVGGRRWGQVGAERQSWARKEASSQPGSGLHGPRRCARTSCLINVTGSLTEQGLASPSHNSCSLWRAY